MGRAAGGQPAPPLGKRYVAPRQHKWKNRGHKEPRTGCEKAQQATVVWAAERTRPGDCTGNQRYRLQIQKPVGSGVGSTLEVLWGAWGRAASKNTDERCTCHWK